MAILSYEFALCFALFFIIYWACYRRPQVQNALLITASIGFILTWQWLFLASIIFVWLVLQACTYGFLKATSPSAKKGILIAGLIALTGHLCFFKYSNFIIEQLNVAVLSDSNSLTPIDIIMPLGVSFYTFQAISYLVDVYQKKMEPMPSAILFGFLSFIPTLTAGPIFRAKEAQKQWLLQPVAMTDDKELKIEEQTEIASESNLISESVSSLTAGSKSESIAYILPNADALPSITDVLSNDALLNKDMTTSSPRSLPPISFKVDNGDNPSYWRQTKQQSPLYYRIDISAGLQVGDNIPIVESPIDSSVPIVNTHTTDSFAIESLASDSFAINDKATTPINDKVTKDKVTLERAVTTSKPAQSRRYVMMPYLALALIAIALFKKLVLAGWLESIWVTPVFSNPLQFHGLEVLTAIYAYALQLFFDFSGYTDLVVAIALLLGFRLPENFRQPYLATDIQDFWKKWHITLSTWIKDYLYIPLGGGRRRFWRVQINLMLAFIISGVWHGAGWNFFVWGAIHGIALVFLNVLKRFNLRFWLTKHAKPLAIFLTFHYVCFGWIFFHSVTFDQALQMIGALGNYGDILFSLPVVPTLAIMAIAWVAYPYLGQAREQIARLLSILPWWSLPIPIAFYVVLLFNLAPEGLPGFIYANF